MGSFTKKLMIGIAVIFDIIEIILTIFVVGLVVNRILTVIEYVIFGTWFWFLGVKFLGKVRNGDYLWFTLITELVPAWGALPGLTFGVVMTIKGVEKDKKQKKQEAQDSSKTRTKKKSGAKKGTPKQTTQQSKRNNKVVRTRKTRG